jgi:hypothetical protein
MWLQPPFGRSGGHAGRGNRVLDLFPKFMEQWILGKSSLKADEGKTNLFAGMEEAILVVCGCTSRTELCQRVLDHFDR